MKTLKLFSLLAISFALTTVASAQKTTTETFAVSGNCGMCKSKIEKAAKEAGASFALWDVDKKELTVKYSSSSTNTAKIQQKIADAGYDNAGFKSTLESYNSLHGCCQYERVTAKTDTMDCCKEGKCTKDGKCTKEGHEGKDCCKKDAEKKQ